MSAHIYMASWELKSSMGVNVVEMDDRGRITLPARLRRELRARRFLVLRSGKEVRLIPLRDPLDLKGSVKIPWSTEELKEAGEESVAQRAEW